MHQRIVSALLVAGASGTAAWAQSVWLPAQQQFIATPGVSFSTFDEFWTGQSKVSNPPNGESLNQYTGFLSMEYGILPRLAADLTLGYTGTDTDAFGADSDSGLADTQIGLRYLLLEEQDVRPAVGIRLGGVIAGSYDENLPFSAGDGAHGLEASLLLGKRFGESGFGAYGDLGYRFREAYVPEDLFGSVGLFKEFEQVFHEADAITVSAGYRHVQGLHGLNIGGAGFDPSLGPSSGFPALREINMLVEGSVGYTDQCGRFYQFTTAKTVDGRNTGDKWIFLLTVSLPFGGRQ